MSPPESDQTRVEPREWLSNRTANIIMAVVTVLWAANIVFSSLTAVNWEPNAQLNGVFMLIVGGAFVARYRLRNGGT